MADYDDYEDNYEDSENLVKDLRKQLKQLSKEKSELSQELASFKQETRQRSLAEMLEAKGINARVAKFIPEDVDTEESVSTWLEENAEIFGVSTTASADSAANEPSSEERSAADRLRSLSENASTPSKADDIAAKLAAAQSDDEINAIWADARNYFL